MKEQYKVVIVDDDRDAVSVLKKSLTIYPEFEVIGVASNGMKGKKLVLESRPDLLFLDVELPDILGFNLLEEIRDDILWDMKVVFYTSYNKYLLQILRESAFDCLLKPFKPEDLEVVIARYKKAVASAPPISFSASWSGEEVTQKRFMIATLTGFKLVWLGEIGYFEYFRDKRQWQVVLADNTRQNLRRNSRAEDIIGYSDAFVQISQSVILNINYLALIDDKYCLLCPPFNDRTDLTVSRNFMKGLQDRFLLF